MKEIDRRDPDLNDGKESENEIKKNNIFLKNSFYVPI